MGRALYAALAKIRMVVDADPASWSDTRLYFFFSGHGIAPSARDASGLAADAGPDHYGNSVSIKALIEWLLESQDFGELVMIADACRNKPPSGTRRTPPWTPRNKRRGEVRVAEFYATVYGDPAREPRPDHDPDGQRGYFTKAILDGLKGHAPIRPGGVITATDLGAHARQHVIEATGGKQAPPKDVGADVVLVEGVAAVAAPTRPVRLVFPAGFAGEVELLDTKFTVATQTTVASGEWLLSLEPSLYKVVSEANAVAFVNDGAFAVPVGEGEIRVTI